MLAPPFRLVAVVRQREVQDVCPPGSRPAAATAASRSGCHRRRSGSRPAGCWRSIRSHRRSSAGARGSRSVLRSKHQDLVLIAIATDLDRSVEIGAIDPDRAEAQPLEDLVARMAVQVVQPNRNRHDSRRDSVQELGVLEVLLPWCGTTRTSACKSSSSSASTSASSAGSSMSPVIRNDRPHG